jgi:hypothetical protein
MKNGTTRSRAWIARRLKDWTRDDEALQLSLMLVSIAPIPSLIEIGTWTDEQCALAEDWAGCVHFSASDNNNRVPAVPEHLAPYQHVKRLKPDEIAKALVLEMAQDNSCNFTPTIPQMKDLAAGVERMQGAGCFFTDAEVVLFSSGEEGERQEHFARFNGFNEADAAITEIFDNALA